MDPVYQAIQKAQPFTPAQNQAPPRIGVNMPPMPKNIGLRPGSPPLFQPADSSHLAPWASSQVQRAGGNPADFRMDGRGTMISAKPPTTQSPPSYLNDETPENLARFNASFSAPGGPGSPGSPGGPGIPGSSASSFPPAPPMPMPQPGQKIGVQGGMPKVSPNIGISPAKTFTPTYSQHAPMSSQFYGPHSYGPMSPAEKAMADQIAEYGNALSLNGGNFHPAIAAAMLQARASLAEAMSQHEIGKLKDPVGSANAMMNDPVARQAYFAGKGQPDPGPPLLPGQAIDASNFGKALGENPDFAKVLNDKDFDLQDRLQRAASFPGVSDPYNRNHQILQQYLNQTYTTPQQWMEDTYVPPDPSQTAFTLPNGFDMPVWLNRPLGMMAALGGALVGDNSTGTGWNWKETHAKRSKGLELLRRLNLQNPTTLTP